MSRGIRMSHIFEKVTLAIDRPLRCRIRVDLHTEGIPVQF